MPFMKQREGIVINIMRVTLSLDKHNAYKFGIARDCIYSRITIATMNNMNRIAITFALLCALLSTFAFEFEDCGSELVNFETSQTSISGCTTSDEKCFLHRGTEVDLSIKFTPTKDISNLKARAFGVLFDVPVEFPLEKSDVCKDTSSGITCPLKKDQEVEYKATFPIDKRAPTVNVDVLFDFINEDEQKVICIKYPVKIK